MLRYTKCIFEALFVLMRKAILLFVLFAMPFLGKAQSKNINIYWGDTSTVTKAFVGKTSTASSNDLALERLKLQMDKSNVQYTTQWKDAAFADRNSVTVTNVRFGPISSEELKRITPETLPNKLEYHIASTMARNVLYTIFTISPIIKNNGSYQKVLSFDVNYKYGPQNRNNPPTITNSVLATGQWFKFKVEQNGIYKLDKNFLNSLGMKTALTPEALKFMAMAGNLCRYLIGIRVFLISQKMRYK